MARMMRGIAPENVDGVWVQCLETLRVQLRPILPTKDQEIDLSHPMGVVKYSLKDGTEEHDPQKAVRRANAIFLEKGAYALMDTEGFEVQASDDEWRAFLSKALKLDVAKDSWVKLDGNWTPEVKQRVLSNVENEGAICPLEVEVEVDGRKKTSTVMLTFDVWVVRMAQKLGRDSAARSAELKS